jgi:hypothetical protein
VKAAPSSRAADATLEDGVVATAIHVARMTSAVNPGPTGGLPAHDCGELKFDSIGLVATTLILELAHQYKPLLPPLPEKSL